MPTEKELRAKARECGTSAVRAQCSECGYEAGLDMFDERKRETAWTDYWDKAMRKIDPEESVEMAMFKLAATASKAPGASARISARMTTGQAITIRFLFGKMSMWRKRRPITAWEPATLKTFRTIIAGCESTFRITVKV